MFIGNRAYRHPGQGWDYCPSTIETAQDILFDLFDELVNNDDSDTLGCDVAIRTSDGVFHLIAKVGDTPDTLAA